MFSKTCEYAIRAMLYIAQHSASGHKTGIKEIARNVNVPEFFIAKILQDLGKKQLVLSAKGPNGGFYLDEAGMSIPLSSIVVAIDGDKIFSGCGLGLEYCSETKPCPIHFQFKQIREEIYQMLSNARIGQFHELLENQLAFLKRD